MRLSRPMKQFCIGEGPTRTRLPRENQGGPGASASIRNIHPCMRNSCAIPIRRSASGFSLLEMMIVLAIIVIVGGFAMPMLMTQVYLTRIRYSATGVSGLLQLARMEAVRKNSFYSLNYVAGTPAMVRVVDKNAAVVTTIPPVVLGQSVTSFFGSGSGAPGETAFFTTLSFTVATASSGSPSFNSRGLPCIASGGTTCLRTLNQGFVFFLSGTNSSGGAVGWSALTVTPSGRCQVFAYDGTNWIQQ